MKKRFSTLKVDEGKLNLAKTVEYRPLEEDHNLVLTIEPLQNGELMSYTDLIERTIDLPKLFRKKVVKIEGLTIESEDGKEIPVTPQMITSIADPDFNKIVMTTTAFILSQGSLTGDEEKN